MPGIAFEQPLFLLLTLLLIPLYWWIGSRRSAMDLAPARRRAAFALRLLVAVPLILALAGVHIVKKSGANCILFVIDASQSLSRRERQQALEYVNEAARNMRGQDKIGVVSVGADARLAFAPSERGKVVADVTVTDASQTNLARGITTALSYFPDDVARRIVLITDGNENAGSAIEAARSAAAEDIPIDVVPIGGQPEREALLERMLTPPSAKRGEPFPVKVIASSTDPGTGTVRLYRNGKYVGEQAVDLKPGKNVLTLTDKTDAPGFYSYEARLETGSGGDTITENNRALSFVRVRGQPRVLLVRPDDEGSIPDTALPRALRAQNVTVDVVSPRNLPTQAAALLNYEGIILSDVPADALTEAQMSMVRAAVRDLGIGLTMIGGERGFGAGGYWQTPIEEALPVDMDIRKMRRLPGVALALSIDYSGSMNSAGHNTSGTQSKLDLAQEAAHRAVDALSPQDQVGVMAVDTKANVVVPMQYAQNKKAIHEGIGAIYGGGGTEMSAAIKASFVMLEKSEAKIKHAILVTDGATRPYDYSDIIRRMRQEKMTFTLVQIDEGQGAGGTDPLKKLATATGGRYYRVRDAAEIPKIYTREVQTVSRPPIVEEPFLPRIAEAGSPLLSGISIGDAPPLLGYDVVSAKPTAEVALTSHKGDTVLATWQYGLGKSVAFTSDAKARWGAQWLGWGGYGPFWAQAVRWSLKRPEQGSYQSGIEVSGGKGQITVDAVDEKTGAYVNFLDARARVIGPDGGVQTVRLTQTGSGRYVGSFDAAKTGAYVATVTQKGRDGKTRAAQVGVAVPYSPEFAALKPNVSLLTRVADLTGGSVLKDGSTVFGTRRVRRVPVPLALPLLLFALLLFPLDVANRRLNISPGQAGEMATAAQAKVRERMAERQEQARQRALAANASVGRLVDKKARMEAEESEEYGASPATPTSSSPAPAIPTPQRTTGVIWGAGAGTSSSPMPSSTKKDEATSAAGDYRSRLMEAKRRAAREEET